MLRKQKVQLYMTTYNLILHECAFCSVSDEGKKNKRRGRPVGNKKKTDTVNANKENDEESCAKRPKGEFVHDCLLFTGLNCVCLLFSE